MRKEITPLSKALLELWHPSKNGDISSDMVSAGSGRAFWWTCEKGHEWQAKPLNLRRTGNCPVCSNKLLIPGNNDLKTLFPALADQWHPTKNIDLLPEQIVSGYSKKVWWICCKGHEWEAQVASRVRHGYGCPYCSGQRAIVGENDLATTRPDLAKEWHPSKNAIDIESVKSGTSNSNIWWLGECGHEWKTSPYNRSKGSNCPYCSGNKVEVGVNDIETLLPELVKEWHPTKNEGFLPENFSSGSPRKVWWVCDKNHEWEASIVKRTVGKTGCPVCANRVIIPGFNDLAYLNPKLAGQWSSKNSLKSSQISIRAGKKVWWLGECGHEWKAIIAARTAGSGCPICANQQIQIGFNDVATTHPDLVKEWHPTKNNLLKPTQFVALNETSIWWLGKCGHEWESKLRNRAGKDKSGCPRCAASIFVSKAEKEVAEYVKSLGLNIFTSIRTVIRGELDIYAPEKNIAIEFNGLYWHNEFFANSDYHKAKYQKCKDKGIQLIQVWEDDWLSKPDLVKRMLAYKLGVSSERKVFARNTTARLLTQDETNSFLDENHIQGAVDGGIRVGLFENIMYRYTEKKPVAVMVLKREAGTEGKTLNLLRYATGVNVVGGFTKLLKYVEREFKPESIVTFSDNTVSDGGLYENNGFKVVKELKPDYMYVVRNQRVHKFNYRLKRFREDPELQYVEGLSERELALLNNLPRVWDAGKIKWERTF